MNERIELRPAQVSAEYRDGMLMIHAAGREDGVEHIRIDQLGDMPIEPPEFVVVGEAGPVIGNFPYSVNGSFPYDHNPGVIDVSGESVKVAG
jgi:hypothetical protein